MQITLNLQEEWARHLGQDAETISRAALEALALEGIRSGKFSTAEAHRLLGFRTCNQMDGFLKAHGVDLPLTMAQVSRDSDTALAFSE